MMYKHEEEVDRTYFKKIKKTVIDEVNEGDVIYLKVRNAGKSTIRHWEYYGKLIKKTNHFFIYWSILMAQIIRKQKILKDRKEIRNKVLRNGQRKVL